MSAPADLKTAEKAIAAAMARDREALLRRLQGLRKRHGRGLPIDRGLGEILAQASTSAAERDRRAEQSLALRYDPELPITDHVDAIRSAIQDHPVVVVAGETGSGKTTQLPKICLEAGRGVEGWIGCTQPRRIAARTIAARLAEEMGVQVGAEVGYQVRFDERVSPESRIKVMTDGVLLAETPRDRRLMGYDTLIIDEAHERSLNIDFLLGYLRRLLEDRDDLRVIITSATIDTERFARHFNDAPIIEVSGRTYPVEIRYRQTSSDEQDTDLQEAIAEAVDELGREDPRGDVLVFLPGERDIRETLEKLERRKLRDTEILPLYSRLSAAEQNRIFHPGRARRIILSTNVAETSLTVPRIRFVIDAGTARISRYSHRSKVQRLPIEAISQASANQRAGRCGRLGPGVCLRLYGQEDFEGRAEFTEPEIVRTNLAAVILQMETLGLGPLADFPFLDRPDERLIRDGYQLLFELGALDRNQRITTLGRTLARWPLDVRLARLLAAAQERDCLAEGLTLAAVLSIQDPRERPLDKARQADECHQQWADSESDFVAFLNLWRDWSQARKELTQRKLRAWCRERFISYVRMREWSDLRRQLLELVREQDWALNAQATEYEPLHRALITAFISQIGLKDDKGYVGARQHRFQIFPGSGLFKSRPQWLMTAFLMETAQVYARVNARIEPEWVERAAGHLIKQRVFDPYWSKRAGRVLGYEQITLYGIPLVSRRRVHFGPHDPEAARKIFLLEALVRGQTGMQAPFLDHNRQLLADIESLEERQRKRDLLVDETTQQQFFEARVPEEIHNEKDFKRWRKQAETNDPELLFFGQEDLFLRADHEVTPELYPDTLATRGVSLDLSYRLDPGRADDGMTVHVPLAQLNTVATDDLEWLVPGARHEKVTALIKSLPKVLRRHFVPAPDVAREFLDEHPEPSGSLLEALAVFLSRRGQAVEMSDFSPLGLPDHLRVNIAVEDQGKVVDQGRDLGELQQRWASEAREEFLNLAGQEFYADDLAAWDFGELPEVVELDDGAEAFPALVDQEDAAGIRLFPSRAEAAEHHRYGVRRLLEFELRDKFRYLHRSLEVDQRMCLQYAPVDTCQALRRDLIFAVSMAEVDEFHEMVRDAEGFRRLTQEVRTRLLERANQMIAVLGELLDRFHAVRTGLDEDFCALFPHAFDDLGRQLEWLVYPGFLTEVPADRLAHYPRYLKAIQQRMERLELDPARDQERQERVQSFWDEFVTLAESATDYTTEMAGFHWLIEEYRVSLFAQELKTAVPVSPKRLKRAWEAIQETLRG